ncbi:tetratricopeptide repeat protein [Holzapfeliella sp. He02]|uniref:Tetratricopeptide repeat protein n=1 Tax=Holzapfeliella saturejae TaxID=3082953 RepID=A0ABU8SG28_9LACO
MNKKAQDLFEQGQTDEAVHLLVEQIDQNPKETAGYLQLSLFLVKGNELEKAIELLLKAANLVENPKDLYFNLATSYYLKGDLEKSLNLLNQLPDTADNLYQKALVYFNVQNYQKALAYGMTAEQKNPTDTQIQELMGDLWLAMGELTQAQRYFEKIIATKPTAKAYTFFGICLYSQDYQKAQDCFEQATKLDEPETKKILNQYESLLSAVKDGKLNG